MGSTAAASRSLSTLVPFGAAALLLAWAPAHASGPLVHIAGNHCADVQGGSTALGAPVITWACTGGSNQRWTLTAAGQLRTYGGTRCLDAKGNGQVPGTPVLSYGCIGGANQRWRLESNGTIVGVGSGLCLAPRSGSSAANVALQLSACNGTAGQRWRTTGVGDASADTQAPGTPSGLAISSLACRSVKLSWRAATDNVGVTGYDIYHDGQRMTSVAGTVLSTTLTVTPGARWGLYVNARDAAGNVSQASGTLPIVVPACQTDTQRPTIPTRLSATATGTTVTLTWAASSDNVAVTGYEVLRDGAKVTTTPNLQYTDSGLAAGTSYSYRVRARDAAGNTSDVSVAATVATAGGGCANVVCGVKQVSTDTDVPWGLVALKDGSVLYSRRDAQDIVRVTAAGVRSNVGKVPGVVGSNGEGGLLGLAVTPNFPATDPWLYIYHTTATDNRIIRIQYRDGVIDTATRQVLLTGIARNKYHNGGRLRFGPDGKLYAAAGDGQNENSAQNTQALSGKILRINADGTIPSDNPFGNAVWSYGHRNPQGLAFDAQGRLWSQEFGNSLQDETNLIVKGGNYGWPLCEGTIFFTGAGCSAPGLVAPKHTYSTSEGSCSGIAVVRGALYVACARGARMYRLTISGTELTNPQQLFVGTYGRLRTVEPSIDGGLWLTTTTKGDKDDIAHNSDEKLLKVQLGQ